MKIRGIRVRMWGIRVGMMRMRGIGVGIRVIRVGMRGIGVGMWGIRVGMQGTGGGNEEDQGENLRIRVAMMNKNVERDKNKRKSAHL